MAPLLLAVASLHLDLTLPLLDDGADLGLASPVAAEALPSHATDGDTGRRYVSLFPLSNSSLSPATAMATRSPPCSGRLWPCLLPSLGSLDSPFDAASVYLL